MLMLKNGDFYIGSDSEGKQGNQSDDDPCPSVEQDFVICDRVRHANPAIDSQPLKRLLANQSGHTFQMKSCS